MRTIQKSAWVLAAVSGVLQVLIFPLPNLYFLCWIAYAPLLVALLRTRRNETVLLPESLAQGSDLTCATPIQGFVLAWVSGIVATAGSCFWMFHAMHQYGGLDFATSLGLLVLFCLWIGSNIGLFGIVFACVAGAGHDKKSSSVQRALLAAPFLWIAVELIRARVLGFPWNLLGNAQVDNIPLTRIATVTGVYGVSFEIMLVNCAFAAAMVVRRPQRKLMYASAIAAALIVQLSVFIRPPQLVATETARLVQANIPIREQWTRPEFDALIEAMRQDSVPSQSNLMPGEPVPSIIVWPESPAPFFVDDPSFRQAVGEIARKSNAYVIVGSVGTSNVSQMGRPQDIFNSAALVSPTGEWVARYDKVHLVPFGEYVPFSKVFSFAQKLTKEVGNFVPGTRRSVFDTGSYKVGVFICYESAFPSEVRQFAANGGTVLATISNDGWFGYYGAPEQHLNTARMRAIENNRWLLRATNTGITASVDPFGRIIATAPRDVRTTLDAPFSVVTDTTFYTRHGDWFAYLCAIISLVALSLGVRTRISKKPQPQAAE